jgi:hypothetical protein
MTKAFPKLEKAQSVLNGRSTTTLTEPILQTLHKLLINYTDIKGRLDKLHLLLRDFAYSERASQMDFLL